MGLDEELCRKARDLYRWEMKFVGDLLDLTNVPTVEARDWITPISGIHLALASQPLKSKKTYGFIDPQAPTIYHHVATIYSGREHDFQEDLLRASLMHILKVGPIQPTITFPQFPAEHVRSYHLFLLNKDNLEVQEFPGEYIPIRELGDRRTLVQATRACQLKAGHD